VSASLRSFTEDKLNFFTPAVNDLISSSISDMYVRILEVMSESQIDSTALNSNTAEVRVGRTADVGSDD
jgi:hypothetical protein